MVTKGYQKGVYERVTVGTTQIGPPQTLFLPLERGPLTVGKT